MISPTAYYDSYVAIAAAEGSDIQGLDDLQGQTVAAKTGTQGASCAESLKDQYGFEIQYFDESSLMYQDVVTGNTVACFEDYPVMAYGVSQGKRTEDRGRGERMSTPLLMVFAVLKGQNSELLEMFNTGLANIKANGTYDEIIAKYTSAE